MDVSSTVKISFDSVPEDNQALAAEIQALVHNNGNKDPDETQLKSLLKRLYAKMCDFCGYRGNAATPDAKILAAWESFFEPIKALAQVKPHGHMMAARMTLYLASAFLKSFQLSRSLPMSKASFKPMALRCDFLIALDDALLSYLIHIWSHGNKLETFPWVFTDYPVYSCRSNICCADEFNPRGALHEQRTVKRFEAACVTRPSDLTPENGICSYWEQSRPEEGRPHDIPEHPDLSRPAYVNTQCIASNGPARETYSYGIVDEDTGQTQWRGRLMLRRSRQFVLDARKIAKTNLAKDRRRLAERALARSPLPLELEADVLGYLEDIPEHPYLSKLDLAAVYKPFPESGKKCVECASRGNKAADKMFKATCPQKSVAIWSLPLRMFHTFHRNRQGGLSLCIHSDCNGHHHDSSWLLRTAAIGLEDHLNGLLQGRCGPGVTLKSIGLGPLDPALLPTMQEDSQRRSRLFQNCWGGYNEKDVNEENLWIGINGLVDVILHGKVLIGLHTSGRSTTDINWMLGRTRQDEQRARLALTEVHSHCAYC
ncbi:hypothetical protein VP1G_01951 [Cytospora mali]|uniref:Uncharacterized protein n=1 Tax=Cytospora mali TaxID=578113 RepID=A0A194US83_CYTMA|nr:hypothetical protein VP1G_01951 [Valsa mali var. pyri (nom. inval.)]